ncbi:MAG: CCA tRNA nucleotidyltransferase, partial [Candidatus Dadabacteria bacterium]
MKTLKSKDFVVKQIKDLLAKPPLKQIISSLEDAELCLVGGALRDLFLGESPLDFDLATSLSSEEIIKRCSKAKIVSILPNPQHSTVLAIINKHQIEITPFRGEQAESSIETDLPLRDFTINSLAYHIGRKEIIDLTGGLRDLAEGILRANKPAEKIFKDDPLRILRMVRFGEGAGRKVEEETLNTARALRHLIKQVAVERIRDELVKILLLKRVKEAFYSLDNVGVLEILLPELAATKGFQQNEFHTEDLFNHT